VVIGFEKRFLSKVGMGEEREQRKAEKKGKG